MSPPAYKAFMAVMIEVADDNWRPMMRAMERETGDTPQLVAAKKLIGNHFRLLLDICNPRSQLNIEGIMLTQADLARVEMKDAKHVDAALREAARRLLGTGGDPVALDSSDEARGARKKMAAYLEARTHSDFSMQPAAQHSGRNYDMPHEAAEHFKETMHEVAEIVGMAGGSKAAAGISLNTGLGGGSGAWGQAADMLSAGAFSSARGAASRHSLSARDEAARKLVGNHENLLKDICNPSRTDNIICIPLTQKELARVDPKLSQHVDEGLVETCRRLLGRGFTDALHPSRAACGARAAAARYLYYRIQSNPDQKPDRKPDMSEAAAAAMKDVLIEVGSTSWEPLKALLVKGASSSAPGVAGKHSQKARNEAATKMIGNHFNLMLDVCNPMPYHNIIGDPLTQPELARVSAKLGHHVDEGLQEVARRLLGQSSTLDPSPVAQEARAQAARYLYFRIQGVKEQKPGRTPDMSEKAANAMKAVLIECGSSAWEPLKDALAAKGANANAEGVAGIHSQKARQEAATKILSNHFNLMLDVCNPRKELNIIGVPLTQKELQRVPAAAAPHVEQGLREVVRRLLNEGPIVALDHSQEAQQARVTCATYLQTRIQGNPNEKKGRKPDMSEAAAQAFKEVLQEVASSTESSVNEAAPSTTALKLATDFEMMAAQLKLGGRLTPAQIKNVSEQMAAMGDVESKACVIQ